MGDKVENCRRGIREIDGLEHTRVTGESRYYRTSPVDYKDQDWFVNAAITIETRMGPVSLLLALQQIQKKIGRKKDGFRFGPRILDLDIIFFDEMILSMDHLVIPHPRMHKRAFVLKPICDMDQTIVHPLLNKDVKTLLDGLGDDEQEIYPI